MSIEAELFTNIRFKDNEWAKKEIKKIQALTFDAYEAAVIANNKHFQMKNSEQLAFINKVLEIINQLDEPEVLSQEWIDNHTAGSDTIAYYSEEDVPVVTVSDLEKLLVPKVDLPEIPDYVAEYIKNEQINGLSLKESLEKVNKQEYHGVWVLRKTSEYLDDNFEKYIDAYRNGYTVEEKKYRVLVGKGTHTTGLFLSKSPYGGDVTIGTNLDYYYNDTSETHLTEEEIKNYDERFWPFREPVEELEE